MSAAATETAKDVKEARVVGFFDAKRRIVEALDFRIEQLTMKDKALDAAAAEGKYDDTTLGSKLNRAEDAGRLDELETFRRFVKGMVVKV